MIIDCHGHYTTAPKALEAWRNRQIAGIKDPAQAPKVAELKISDETVQGHVKNILAKLSVHDRTEAVAVAVRRGIVHLD